ncbi:MAG: biotin transporter BioY [Planctomycetes bacterium]|nr:biotin transporter BioY [Planctomycetota bacterium]
MASATHIMDYWDEKRSEAFDWRNSLSIPARLGLSVGVALLTGVLAQIRFHVPGTPVPVTGQVFAVLLAGILLGQGYGALSMAFYVTAGAFGLPWFNGLAGGFAMLAGPTGGYLLGFIPAAALIGFVADKYPCFRKPIPLTFLMVPAVGIIYLFGAVHYALYAGVVPAVVMHQAVFPFIIWDVCKALLAAVCAGIILPKNPYN